MSYMNSKVGDIMIKIAIVDDESAERKRLIEYFQEIQKDIHEELEICTYCSGDEFLEQINDTFDLICLDIDMKGKDGISTAREIRKFDEQVIIIFITNMAQMAIKGYEVRALDFVVKPVNYYSFAMKMVNACNMIRNRKKRNIIISTTGGMKKFSTDELYYVEVTGHYLYYHTKTETLRQKTSLKEVEDRLNGLSFKRCNNCYLVNLKYVQCVNKDELKVGEQWLKISRPRKKEFLQSLANYMGGIKI